MIESVRKLDPRQRKIFYLGVPQHCNLGDLAQQWCIKNWLEENYPGVPVAILPDTVIVEPEYGFVKTFKQVLGEQDIIFFQSGYNTQDIGGRQDEMHRIICDNFPDARIVFMPQTVLFLREENRKRTSESHDKCRHALFLGRDMVSTETAKEMFPHLPVLPYPDIVTTLIGRYGYNYPRDGVFFCVRDDLERLYTADDLQDCAGRIAADNAVKIDFGDTTIDKSHARIVAALGEEIENIIRKFARYRLVITDRYHGTIFSLVAGTPVIVIKSNDHKVTTGVDWFKGIYDDRVFLADDLKQAAELAGKLLKQPVLPQPVPYFKEHYYDHLKELISRYCGE